MKKITLLFTLFASLIVTSAAYASQITIDPMLIHLCNPSENVRFSKMYFKISDGWVGTQIHINGQSSSSSFWVLPSARTFTAKTTGMKFSWDELKNILNDLSGESVHYKSITSLPLESQSRIPYYHRTYLVAIDTRGVSHLFTTEKNYDVEIQDAIYMGSNRGCSKN